MDVEEQNSDNINSSYLISKNLKSRKNKKYLLNLSPKKLAIGFLLITTFLAFILLINLSNNKSSIYSLETTEKQKSKKNEINYSFVAVYETHKESEQVELIKNIEPEDIKELFIDGERAQINIKQTFEKKGAHTVHMLLDEDKIKSLEGLFSGIISLASISFSKHVS